MNKTLILMFLIFGLGINSLVGLDLTSVSFHGADGPSDTTISLGETVTVNFSYTTSGLDTAPVMVKSIAIYSGGYTNFTQVTNYQNFSGALAPSGTSTSTTFVMPAVPSTDEDIVVAFSIEESSFFENSASDLSSNSGTNAEYEETLPVELSSFTAVATTQDFVNISWTVHSETNISGYFIIRGLQNNIETAEMIPAFINATNGAQEHSYSFTDQEVTTNNIYFYWLQSVEFSLQTELFGPIMVKVGEPTGGEVAPVDFGTQLIGNYPNPFNPSTSVSFSVASPSNVVINIYNVKGQLVKNLYDSFVPSNKTNRRIDVLWNGKDNSNQEVASGVYYSKMEAGKHTEFKKMLLIK